MTEYPATEADTQPTADGQEHEHPGTGQPSEGVEAPADGTMTTLDVGGPEMPEDQRIPDDEAALLTEDPTAPNPYTDDEDGDA